MDDIDLQWLDPPRDVEILRDKSIVRREGYEAVLVEETKEEMKDHIKDERMSWNNLVMHTVAFDKDSSWTWSLVAAVQQWGFFIQSFLLVFEWSFVSERYLCDKA